LFKFPEGVNVGSLGILSGGQSYLAVVMLFASLSESNGFGAVSGIALLAVAGTSV
jgi:hypothetical protein